MAYPSAHARALILGIALLGAACNAQAAPLASCPQQQREGKTAAPLDSASVFDGPPANLVDLMPDFATLEWDLSSSQEQARARGESIYLVCKYKGGKSTVTLKLPHEATLCKVEGIKNRTVVSCSAARKDTGTTPP